MTEFKYGFNFTIIKVFNSKKSKIEEREKKLSERSLNLLCVEWNACPFATILIIIHMMFLMEALP
jgi:hypothetical protein